MNEKKAFEIVYNELIKNPMFRGVYDARYGDKHFMYGVCTVIEVIANNISEETYNEYFNLWADNMTKSEERK